ncbi:MAG: hypothetical protein K8T10_17910 [Candidatus Eremiobacteraeota bacterium]|nr:hypothetical protein [Candidatus Eremiobacteraeota bacterium]
MVALVVTGKFKNPEMMEKAIGMEGHFVSHGKKLLEKFHCKGGVLLTHPDGKFSDISFWDNEEDAKKIMENSIVKEMMKMSKVLLDGEMKVDYADVSISLGI